MEITRMESTLYSLTVSFLENYPNATSITLQSLETSIDIEIGEQAPLIKKLNEITILAIDESFETEFSYIFSEFGTVVVFFLNSVTFLSVFTRDELPNKELANKMFRTYHAQFANELNKVDVS